MRFFRQLSGHLQASRRHCEELDVSILGQQHHEGVHRATEKYVHTIISMYNHKSVRWLVSFVDLRSTHLPVLQVAHQCYDHGMFLILPANAAELYLNGVQVQQGLGRVLTVPVTYAITVIFCSAYRSRL